MSADVEVLIEVARGLRGCVGDVEGHFFVIVYRPFCGPGLVNYCFVG